MTSVLMRLRAELRSSWRSWAGYVVLVGLVGALVIAAAAGARRTETAFPRALEKANLTDGGFPVGSKLGFADLKRSDIERLPEVKDLIWGEGFPADMRRSDGHAIVNVNLDASPDPRYGRTINGLTIIRGRNIDPTRTRDAVVDEYAANQNHLDVGDTFTAHFAAARQLDAALSADTSGGRFRLRGPRVRFKVVGIAASFEAPSADPGSFRSIQLSSTFDRAYRSQVVRIGGFQVVLRNGKADIPSFKRGIERLANGQRVNFFTIADFGEQVTRSTHVQAVALWILASLGALVALLVIAQALSRQTQVESGEYSTLYALGMDKHQLLALIMTRTAAIGAFGAVIAVAGAIAISPLTPVGSLARKAEPNPGLSVDVVILLLGAVGIVVIMLAVTAVPAWRTVRMVGASPTSQGGDESAKPSVADRLARGGLGPTAVAGIRMALEPGRGRTAVPVRTAVAGVVLALAAITAALTFAASLNRLTTTPRLYGQTWDAQIGGGNGPDKRREAFPILRSPSVGAFSAGTVDEISINGHRTGVIAMDDKRGSITPTVVEGRVLNAPDEVLLAKKTLDGVGAEIGDVVTMAVGDRSTKVRVVGRCVMPDFSSDVSLGRGAFLTFAGYRRLVPLAPRNTFLVRFAAGVDKKSALARLRRAGRGTLPSRPTDLANFSKVDSMPFVIGGVLGAAALATLVHTLLSSVRRRRRDLAILKTLGFERSQVSRAVAWQATTIILIALLIGIPLGIASGRWVWTIFANQLGVVPETVVPGVPTLLLIPAALIAANLIAALPARLAARTRPAIALRAE